MFSFHRADRTDWRDLGIALSLSNLCYLRVWSELLTYIPSDTYLMKSPPAPIQNAAAILNVLLLGILLWLAVRLARRWLAPRAWLLAQIAFFLLLLVPLNALRSVLSNRFQYLKGPLLMAVGAKGMILLGLALSGLLLILFWFWRRQMIRFSCAFLLILFPFVPITFTQAVRLALKYDPARFVDKPLAAPLAAAEPEAPRVLWIIFDEWDYRLTFLDRPPHLRLPELDRFRREALSASHASSPHTLTLMSMPALITGIPVRRAAKLGPDQLLLTFRDSRPPAQWKELPNVFSKAREMGFNTALVGWFHPYGRVLNESLTACWWSVSHMQYNSMGDSLSEILLGQTRSLVETVNLSPLGQSAPIRRKVLAFQETLRKTKEVACNSQFGLALLHLPIPHAPHAYDRRTGEFTLSNSPIGGYLDSLELLDRTLGELRRAMEASGVWEKTTVLASSDHCYRGSQGLDGKIDKRVPFLLKLPGQKEGFTYQPPFNTVLTHDLLLEVLRGQLTNPQAVIAWLDGRSTAARAS